jgi:hypothetical protein
MGGPLKPIPAPHVPGKTDWERFDNAMRKVLSVSKEAAMKMEKSQPHKPKKSAR